MFDIKIKDIMEKDNSELYEIAIDIFRKLQEDANNLDEYDSAERKRWFFQKKIEKPRINFPDLTNHYTFMEVKIYPKLCNVLKDMENEIKFINNLVIDGMDINRISKSSFTKLFSVSMSSNDVINYILEKINKEC